MAQPPKPKDYNLNKTQVQPEQIIETIRAWVDNMPLDPGENYDGDCRMFKAGFGAPFPAVCRGGCKGGKKCKLRVEYDGHSMHLKVSCDCK
jgi:hypothetical protein